jgi:arylsulfatase A
LMTGIYNVRNYIHFGKMDPNSTTFANLLKTAGYATCMAGKWQLGREPVDLPKKFGFDEYCLWQHTRRPERYKNPGLEINGEPKDWSSGEYGPDLVNDYALDFITRKKDEPFFLYYPMMLTHSPYVPTPDSADYDGAAGKGGKQQKKKDGVDPHFRDMVAYADKLVGKLVARLESLKLRDNTLIMFLGDNGTGKGTISMVGDKVVIGGKSTMIHTGTHVPLVVNWPGHVASGKVSKDLVDASDFLPTVCDVAGVKVPAELKIDGRSFYPQLRGERGKPREWVYCWYGPYDALVGEFAANQQYKLYRTGAFFDLQKDIDEKQPLNVESLDRDASAAAALLRGALDQFKDARPANMIKPPAKKGLGKKGADE